MKSPLGTGMEVTASEMAAFLATGFFCRSTERRHTSRLLASFDDISWPLMQCCRHASIGRRQAAGLLAARVLETSHNA